MTLVEQIKELNAKSYSAVVDALFRSFHDARQHSKEVIDKEPNDDSYYDFASNGEKRRKRATISLVEKARQKLKGVVSTAQIEAYFAWSSRLIMQGGYNGWVDRYSYISLSAAIWILDNLALHGKVDQIYPLLPKLDDEDWPDDLFVVPINHPVYDDDLILSLVHLIRHRNTSKTFEDPFCGTLVWEKGKPDNDVETQNNQKAFLSVLKLLDENDVKKAISKYEGDVWRFYRITFAIFDKVEAELESLEKERDQLESQLYPEIIDISAKNNPLLVNPTRFQKGLSAESFSKKDIEEKIRFIESRIEFYVTKFTFTDMSLVNDREKAMGWVKGIVPKELRQELIEFRVDDPFESAFALLYLLDSGSPIPWMYYGSISVAYTLKDQLPFDSAEQRTTEPMLLSEWNDALYEHRYKGYRWEQRLDAEGNLVQRSKAKNLSQLFYINAQTLFPRVVPSQPMFETYLEDLGEMTDREEEAYSLLLFMLNAASIHYDTSDIETVVEDISPSSDQKEEHITIDQSAIISENERLRKKNQELVSVLRTLKQQKKIVDNNLAATKSELSESHQELSDLRELVFRLDNREIPEETIDESIQYPYITPGKILSFGGHPSWIKDMKKKLPNVVFIDTDTLPNADLIRAADVVWIQTNYISHSNYYKIISVAGTAGKQIRYFTSTSSAKCAEQVVHQTQDYGRSR